MKTIRSILTVAVALAALAIPSTAGAAIVHAESAAGGHGHILSWALDYNTVTDDLTVTVTHTKFDGSPAVGVPQKAVIVLVRPNGTERPFNVGATAVTIDDGTVVQPVRASTDNQFGIINKGLQTYPSFATRVSAQRAQLIEFRTEYTPPLGV